MTVRDITLGIVGGSGMLGKAIARGLVKSGAVGAERLWISNTTGARAGFTDMPEVTVTSDNASLAGACDVILLSVPPAMAGEIGISARNQLVISVMAGVSLERLRALTGASRVVRAMSSPAAEMRLAFSPWIGAEAVTEADREIVAELLGAVGAEAEVERETEIEQSNSRIRLPKGGSRATKASPPFTLPKTPAKTTVPPERSTGVNRAARPRENT